MVQVFWEPLCRRHYSSIFSVAYIFRVLLFCSAVVLAFVIAYGTGGFWPKVRTELEQPTVHYSGDALAILEGNQAGQEQIWTTSAAIQAALPNNLASASVQVGEEDYNFDGKPDLIRFKARVQSMVPVNSVKLLLQFTYALKSSVRMKMYCLAYVTASSALQGAGLSADGQLVLVQSAPSAQNTFSARYNQPIFNSSAYMDGSALQAHATLQISDMLAAYNSRNMTTVLTNQHNIWQAGNGNDFMIDVRVRIPANQVVFYRPGLAEMLKWGWVQFLAFYLMLWWLMTRFERIIFRYRILETRVVSDLQSRGPKF